MHRRGRVGVDSLVHLQLQRPALWVEVHFPLFFRSRPLGGGECVTPPRECERSSKRESRGTLTLLTTSLHRISFPLQKRTITPHFSPFSVCSCRGRQLRHSLSPGKAQRHQFPHPHARRPGQEYKRGTIHLHRRTSPPAQEGAAWFPAPPGRSCPAVPRHPVRHGPPQRLPGLALP